MFQNTTKKVKKIIEARFTIDPSPLQLQFDSAYDLLNKFAARPFNSDCLWCVAGLSRCQGVDNRCEKTAALFVTALAGRPYLSHSLASGLSHKAMSHAISDYR